MGTLVPFPTSNGVVLDWRLPGASFATPSHPSQPCRPMPTTTTHLQLSPGQRTAATARLIVLAGIVGWAPAFAMGSVAASLFLTLVVIAGTALLSAARRAD